MTTSESTEKKVRRTAAANPDGLSAEERAAIKDLAEERRTSAKRGSKATREDGERDLLAKIEGLDEPERTMAQRIHALVSAEAPELWPQTFYGMPAWGRDGKAVFFFKPGPKYRMRYSTLGFTDKATLDDGDMWPSEFAVQRWSDEVAARITELVRAAVR
jgi:uncharacterized protein YdhG (YjbR/CyaY superfamily)